MEYVEVKCKIDGVERSFKRMDPCPETVEGILARKFPNAESRELISDTWEAGTEEEAKAE